jgi:proteic killer suppression protein
MGSVRFKDQGTEDVFDGVNSKAARRKCPTAIHAAAARKLDYIVNARTLEDLRVPRGNRLEALAGDRIGQNSIRINDRYRICFRWTEGGATDIEIVDYH